MSIINYHSSYGIMNTTSSTTSKLSTDFKQYSWFEKDRHHHHHHHQHDYNTVDQDHQNFRSITLQLTRILESKVPAYRHKSGGCNNNNNNNNNTKTTLPPTEVLPRNEVLGGYIFVCNNETMQDDLRRQLFGLPPKYKDSVRAIIPGLPLFLYNYSTHQLHGVYQAVSFGGLNIDPTAWQDNKCKLGGSRFPAQVRIRTKKNCKPLEEDAFRPILYHYDGPKFRLQLSVPEALALLDLFGQVEDY